MSSSLLCPKKERILAQNVLRGGVLEIKACKQIENADLSGKIDRIQHEKCCITLTTQCPGGTFAKLTGES